ncbi:2-hydroxyacid dehydrogenase [Cryptosporangium sp. NPDC048952]|uniref:2-hydroxyacid dehydrogenase n=1 Tax=Cryptosporangium sp. NPDC048952 TaxID=3363961 RepID=UPI003716FD90
MTSVLQVGALNAVVAETLAREYGAVVHDPERLASYAESVRVVVTGGHAGVGTALLDALPGLRAIVHFGAGYDGTDVETARARGIVMSNTPDVLNDCVADTAVGLMIDVLRGFSASDRYVRAGRWAADGPYPLQRRASGSRVGIVGLGRIGTAIATRLEAFGCPIAYHNRHEVSGSSYRYEPSLVRLAADVDVLIVSTAGGEGTRGLVSREVLEALGPDGVLVNVARGSVVDQEALVSLLSAGRLGGAGLDVFDDEPHVPVELLDRDDVVLLPHVGSATVATRAAMADLTLANLRSFVDTGTLITPI